MGKTVRIAGASVGAALGTQSKRRPGQRALERPPAEGSLASALPLPKGHTELRIHVHQ